jgi:anti-anti-sigma factor
MVDIQEREQNGITIFALKGKVDTEGAMDLDIALHAALAEGKTKLILDMAELRYINSAGLRSLADALTRAKEAQGDLKLVALNTRIRRVFEIVGFDNFFQMYDNLDEAMKTFA